MPAKAKQQQHQEPDTESEEEVDMGQSNPAKFLNKNFSREFMATLPAKIRDRTKLLISFDDEYLKEQTAHQEQVIAIKKKYEALYQPLYNRRKEIVLGDVKPTEEDVLKGYPEEHKGQVEIAVTPEDGEDTVKGIPQFWLDALRHHVVIDDMITERDAEVLEHLIDISASTLENGFAVTFTFAPNEFMKETQVTKTIYTKREFGQIAIDRSEETAITWNDGKDVTVETVTQKQRSKKSSAVRVVTKTQPCESFFNCFKHTEDTQEAEQWAMLVSVIADRIIPFAVEFVTGEAPDGSSDLDDGEDYYGEEDEEEESEDEEPAPRKGGKAGPSGGNQKDCKQQ